MKCIKKPVEVFAELFMADGKDGKGCAPIGMNYRFRQGGIEYGSIPIKGGYITVKDGDMVITEEDGKKYTCTTDEYIKNFEVIE